MDRDTIILNPVMRMIARIVRAVMKASDPYARISYAQEGEDLLLERIFTTVADGFYVDIGAHHPLRFSNTYLLYRRGWCGLNIDAMPGSMDSFRRSRPRDINIESAVALEDAYLTYHIFGERALNTFDEALARQYVESGIPFVSRIDVRARPLANLLNEYLPAGQSIDLLTVDVEGLDLDVLKSNNWTRFRPKVLIVEELRQSPKNKDESICSYLAGLGYDEFARTYNSVFYMDKRERL